MTCGKGGVAGGVVGRVFTADEAGRKDEARTGEEPCVGPGFVFTVGGSRLEKGKDGKDKNSKRRVRHTSFALCGGPRRW